MTERAEGQIVIGASARAILDVIAGFEAYPDWAGVKSATVLKRDRQGRGTEVAYEVDVPVLGRTRYTLVYRYRPDGQGVSWTTKEATGPVRDVEGEYALQELDEDETRVTYRMSLVLTVPLPGFLRRQGERRVIQTALDGLRRRVEGRLS